VRSFTVRKATKTHGTGKLIEGPFNHSDRVVVTEDVITTGSSALQAVEALRDAGAAILGVLALVDREEGGREAIEREGLSVRVLASARAIVSHLDRNAGNL
jgi:orotate phosphoribosyltransferase